MTFDDDLHAESLRKAAEVKQVREPKADARLDAQVLTEIDREIIRELRTVARTRKDRWVSARSMYTIIKRIRSAWRLAEALGLKNCGDKFEFTRRLVLERVEALAKTGRIHSEARWTATGLERLGLVIPMFDVTITQADREWLGAMHIRW